VHLPGEDREQVFLRITARDQAQPLGSPAAPQCLGRADPVGRRGHHVRHLSGTRQPGGPQRRRGRLEVRGAEPVVGAGAGGHGLQQGPVAAGLDDDRGARHRGALVHHPVRVGALRGAQAGGRESGDRHARDQQEEREDRAQQATAAATAGRDVPPTPLLH
jgi:hypothetical protein